MEFGLEVIFQMEEMLNIILLSVALFNMNVKSEKWRWIVTFEIVVVVEMLEKTVGIKIGGVAKDYIYIIIISAVLLNEKLWKKILIGMDVAILESLLLMIPMYIQIIISGNARWDLSEARILVANTMVAGVCIYLYQLNKKKKIAVNLTKLQCSILSAGFLSVILIISILQRFEREGQFEMEVYAVLILMTSIAGMSFMIVSLWLINSTEKNIKYQYEKISMEKYIKSQEEYVDMLVRKNESIRRFRHDVKGHIIALSMLIEQKKYEEVKDYILHISNIIEMDNAKIYTGIIAVDAIINEYNANLEAKNIDFIWNGRIKGCEEKVEIYD